MDDRFKGKIADFVNGKQRTYSNMFKKLERKGYEDDFLSDVNQLDIEQIILSLYPNSEKNITLICYMLGAYAKYLYEENLLPDDSVHKMILGINRKKIWELAKPNASTRFLSYKKYIDLVEDALCSDMNGEYYAALIQCLYEGIYSDDLSSLANLTTHDVNLSDKSVKVTNSEDDEYRINISDKLASTLVDLGELNYWERTNHYREYRVETSGKYSDSCFKIENRNGKESTEEEIYLRYARAYRVKLRKALDEFGGLKNVRPKQIFVSGIMYRIKLKLDEQGIEMTKAFSHHSRNSIVTKIVQDELNYCHYNTTVGAFREMVNGSIETFCS